MWTLASARRYWSNVFCIATGIKAVWTLASARRYWSNVFCIATGIKAVWTLASARRYWSNVFCIATGTRELGSSGPYAMLCYLAHRACFGNWWKCFLGRRWLCRARAFWSRRDLSADVSCDRGWLARSRLFWRRRDLSSKVCFCWRILSPIRKLTSILISYPPRLPISLKKVSLYIRESYCIWQLP